MFAGFQDVLDPAGLSVAARIAQLVLAGTMITHLTVLRPASARADLLLVADMVHTDLAADIRERRLPGLDPQVAELARALATAQRLSRKAVSHNPWWPSGSAPSSLTPEQQARLDGYLHQLDQAGTAYHRAVRPWWSLTPSTAPRHGHEKHAARVIQPLREGPPERNLLFDGPSAPPPPLVAPVAPVGLTRAGMAAMAPVMPVAPVVPVAPVPIQTGPKTRSITLAISRARGIDPADTGQLIELGHQGLSDIMGRR